MKKLFNICLFVLLAGLYACEDPYKDETFIVYDVKPLSSYLEEHSDNFSEWIHVLKYADMYNAINQASQVFTLFAPTNEAMQAFYEGKRVSSIDELGKTYARQLVQYHLVNDTISVESFMESGILTHKTLSDDALEVSFDQSQGGGMNGIYLNGCHIREFSIYTTNGNIYVMDDVMRPLVESVFEILREKGKNEIMREAITRTGWQDSLNVIADTLLLPTGAKQITRRYYTLLSVDDEVFQSKGISSCDELAEYLDAGTDYQKKENALNRYVAYHIFEGSYKTDDFKLFDASTLMNVRFWQPVCENTIIKFSKEADGTYHFNRDGGDEYQAAFIEEESNYLTKNGYIQQLDDMMPICKELEPTDRIWDVCDYPELANYIGSYGVDGQIFQQGIDARTEPNTELINANLSCYQFQTGPQGMPVSSYGNLSYRTCRTNSDYDRQDPTRRYLHEDMLTVSVGYQGWVSMKTPVMVPGRYKVTLCYGFVNSMDPFRSFSGGSNGGKTLFAFTDLDVEPDSYLLYSSLPSEQDDKGVYLTRMGLFEHVLYEELEFDEMKSYTFKVTLDDPAASINTNFRVLLDYIKFEPVNN